MKRFITDLIDDLKCIKLSDKGWNYIGLSLVILASWYWCSLSDNGYFFDITGCILYCVTATNWILKSAWGKFMMDLLE